MSKLNRLANCHNYFQGSSKKVLCVCSAGLLRSPTAAVVLSQDPFCFNTRAAGITEEFALIPVDDVLLEWADEVVCMEKGHEVAIIAMMVEGRRSKPVVCLEIPDDFEYMDPKLVELISNSYDERRNP